MCKLDTGVVIGATALHTRKNKALFLNAKICQGLLLTKNF